MHKSNASKPPKTKLYKCNKTLKAHYNYYRILYLHFLREKTPDILFHNYVILLVLFILLHFDAVANDVFVLNFIVEGMN